MRRLLPLLLLLVPGRVALGQTALDPAAPPRHGIVRLRSGFSPDPTPRTVLAGGMDSVAVGNCGGFAGGAAPTLELRFAPGRFALTLTASPKGGAAAEADLVLIVRTPEGKWVCDDDSGGDLHPRLVLRRLRAGRYHLWVATYDAGAPVQARVAFSELGRGAAD